MQVSVHRTIAFPVLPALAFAVLSVALSFYNTCLLGGDVVPAVGVSFFLLFQTYSLYAGANMVQTRHPQQRLRAGQAAGCGHEH